MMIYGCFSSAYTIHTQVKTIPLLRTLQAHQRLAFELNRNNEHSRRPNKNNAHSDNTT